MRALTLDFLLIILAIAAAILVYSIKMKVSGEIYSRLMGLVRERKLRKNSSINASAPKTILTVFSICVILITFYAWVIRDYIIFDDIYVMIWLPILLLATIYVILMCVRRG